MLAGLLKKFFQRPPTLLRGAITVALAQPLRGLLDEALTFEVAGARTTLVTPRREFSAHPIGSESAQASKELFVVCENDQLSVRKVLGKQVGQSTAMRAIETAA